MSTVPPSRPDAQPSGALTFGAETLRNQGLPFGLSGAKSGGLNGLFQEEVERAVERQGGRRAVEEKQAAYGREKRTAREESFGKERTRAARHMDTPQAPPQDVVRNEESDELSEASVRLDSAPVDTPTRQDQPNREASQTVESGTARTSDTPGPPPSLAIEPATPAAVPSGAPAGGPVAGAQAASSPQPVTAAVEAPVRAQRAARSPAPAAPGPQGPTAEEVEQAQKILDQLRVGLAGGRRHLTVDLNPAELGRLNLHVAMRRGKLHAILRVDSPETMQLLEERVGEIRGVLASEGLEPESFELHLGFGDRDTGEGRGFRAGRSAPSARNTGDDSPATTSAQPARALSLSSTNTGVDLYA